MSPSHLDARHSISYNVGRDHNVYHVIVAGSTTEQTLPSVLHDLHDVSCGPATSPVIAAPPDFETGSAGDVANGLVLEIVQLLIDRGDHEDDYRTLELELESLRQTLTLTTLAILTYEFTPLGRYIANTITPEVEQISIVLQELLDRLCGYKQGADSTSIRDMWSQVWWSRCDVRGLASLRTSLYLRQKSLDELLMALNSIQWTELGNGVCAGRVSLRDFRAYLRHGPLSLRRVQVKKILVVDHLGRSLPVPTMFCSAWKDFDCIIKGYCKNRFGNRYVERGDYEVLRAEDSRMINRSEFARTVEQGMVLEMSIVMRRATAFKDSKEKCPRCHHINVNAAIAGGWIECCKCSGQFQIAEADEENNDGEYNKEIFSPASQAKNTAKSSNNSNQRPEVDDGTQFFRRIHVICVNDGAIFPDAKQKKIHVNALPVTTGVYVSNRRRRKIVFGN